MRHLLACLLLILSAAPALAVVVDGANQDRYVQAPIDDPGFDNVGRRGPTSAIYLGGGWVLTARHSGMGEVVLGENTHLPVTDSMLWLDDPSGVKADLMLFRIEPEPELPALELTRRAPSVGAPVILVGYGAGRGDASQWNGVGGFRFNPPGVKRWGMNSISPGNVDVPGPADTLTHCFQTDFTPNGVHEAQAAVGDSGGAVFVRGRKGWRLGGVMVSVGRVPGQTPELALFGSYTQAADLSVYVDQIERAMGASSH